jgi:hypothetical protein
MGLGVVFTTHYFLCNFQMEPVLAAGKLFQPSLFFEGTLLSIP